VGRLRTRSFRFALVAALVATLACIAAGSASALSWVDEICPPPAGATDKDKTCPSGAIGTPYSLQIKGRNGCWPGDGSDPNGMVTIAVSNGVVPPGLTVTSSGLVSGTPTQSGTFQFTLVETDHAGVSWCGDNAASDANFTIKIEPGLRIVTNDIPQNASVGQPYSAQLDAQVVTSLSPVTGAAATGATWSVASGFGTGLPSGLTVANGLISGSPTTEGAYSFRIQASLNGASHAQTYSLNVRKPLVVTPTKPLATPPLPTAWEVGLPLSAKLTPSGGTGTYTTTLASGTLPTGLTLGPDGTISGTPSAAGVFRATVRVADNEGRTLDYAANFGVAARLAVSTVAVKPAKVGRLYRAKLASTGGVPVRKWKVLAGPLPKGLHFDPTLGVLSGTPTKAGRYRVTYQVTDGLKVVAKKTLRILVAD